MEMWSKKEADIEEILAKSLESFSLEAEEFVISDLCDGCEKGTENCFPCAEAEIQVSTLVAFLLSEASRWN